ncbi:nuclear transport factor 2 family protein [Luteolibacter yonseiensis]|uniref:Nuclear transport factor 2 family protein n=1 Tax=Luteolibacter yonseiensis TaxID=1144680 RepID=A0A934R126_9BACT|nr:nuclear transport factor 2 family protein [Luteolibacter yonseiensis]MBK1814532.1 nuclear transport factor 2 family protein [Luteolibacter yonseiensis]
MKTTLISLSSAAVMICTGAGQTEKQPAGTTPEMAAVLAKDRAYEEAYAKADVKALAGFFTDDAEYTSDDGRIFSGAAAIEGSLRSAFASNKGAKISIKADSVKVLTPEVVVEKGSTVVTSSSGDESEALYTAVYLKKDGDWKISQLVETPATESSPGGKLSQLSWLIGEWEEADKDAGVTIHSEYQWSRGGSFITRNVTVKQGDEPVLEGWQIIGWDPVEQGIRSWTFDDQGGYAEGRWTGDGQRWLSRETGYSADGSRTTADNTISKSGDSTVFWESGNRTLDGDPQPGIGRIEIHRKKGE